MRRLFGLGISILIFLTLSPVLFLNIGPVRALPGFSVDSPGNVWAPYGPFVKNIRLQYYAYETPELIDFEAGHIDLADWEIPPARYSTYDSNPDFLLSPSQGQFGFYGVYFNGLSSRFSTSKEYDTGANGPFWGCNWNSGILGTTSFQTYVSPCGINMRQAFTHLIDRPSFSMKIGGLAPIADPSPPGKDPSGSNLTTQCSWDAMFSNCISAYRIAPSPTGFAQPGSPDFCAAADHMIAAGVATGKNPGTCVLTGVNAGVFDHPFRFMIRNFDPRRLAIGNGMWNAINQLFGGNAVSPIFCHRICGFPIVFSDPPVGLLDDWDAYTYGYGLPSPYPDHLYDLYSSQFASNYCGGQQNGYPFNDQFVCIAGLDEHVKAVSQTLDPSTLRTEALAAFNILGSHAVEIPVFSPSIRIAALRSVAGLVNERGFGYSNFNTILNAHVNTTYTPENPIYQFGGGDPTTLRWGQASGTSSLNIFHAQTVWEFNVLGEIYDTLFNASPVQLGSIFCWMCTSYTSSVDSSGNEHFLVQLRQNLRWQDGVPIDAYDVKFSWLNFRDNPTTLRGNLPGLLLDIKVLDNYDFDVVWSGQSINYPAYMENYVIPRHLWEAPNDHTYADVGVVDPAKLSVYYDPLSSGTLIGSGPYLCRSVFPVDLGRVGTGCANNFVGSRANQNLNAGATMLLQAYDRTNDPRNTDPFLQYMRSYNPFWGTGSGTALFYGQFQEFGWGDRYDNATVTIQDMASVASCYGASGPTASCSNTSYNYWLKPAFHPNSPNIITIEVSIVASLLDDTWVYPFSWSGNQSRQPGQTLQNITPFTS